VRFFQSPSPLVTLLVAVSLLPGCGVRYVTSSAVHELGLLASRRPIDVVLAKGTLSAGEEQRLVLIPRIKEYGRTLGLASTHNYSSYAYGWDHTIWNVSASEPLAFQPVTWRFPIVGQVPYLGFFTDEEAIREEQKQKARGLDVYRRSAGAFSTLGWFRDPVLPGMLRWDEADLAETVFHELAHATLWVPGSVPFNESFADFVGVAAARRYHADTYGPGCAELADYDRADRDWQRFNGVLHDLYADLDAVYTDPARTDEQKLAAKAELLASLPARIRASALEDPERWVRYVQRAPWNNARLLQFRTYATHKESFAALLARDDGDLRRFIDDIGRATRHARDPYAALDAAAATPAPPAAPAP